MADAAAVERGLGLGLCLVSYRSLQSRLRRRTLPNGHFDRSDHWLFSGLVGLLAIPVDNP